MTWFWLNIFPFIVLIAAVVFGVPTWLVMRHPDAPPMTIGGTGILPQDRPVPAVSSMAKHPAYAASAGQVAA
jgi:hypothetical protein